MKERDSRFGKYIGLYFSRYQRGIFQSLERERRIDFFWPVKLVWFFLVSLGRIVFGERNKF